VVCVGVRGKRKVWSATDSNGARRKLREGRLRKQTSSFVFVARFVQVGTSKHLGKTLNTPTAQNRIR